LYRRQVERAEQIVDRLLKRWTPQRIYLRLFQPALYLSGSRFARGRITYHDEHFITHHTLRLMRRVRRTFHEPPIDAPVALAISLAQQSHRVGLRMVCDLLHGAGWRIVWVEGVERGMLRNAMIEHGPDLLLLSIGTEQGLTQARRLIGEARRRGHRGLIAVGGRIIARDPALVDKLGADLTASDGLDLIRRLRQRDIHATRARTGSGLGSS
jgi:methanogenic corrinoid protein MtbC1